MSTIASLAILGDGLVVMPHHGLQWWCKRWCEWWVVMAVVHHGVSGGGLGTAGSSQPGVVPDTHDDICNAKLYSKLSSVCSQFGLSQSTGTTVPLVVPLMPLATGPHDGCTQAGTLAPEYLERLNNTMLEPTWPHTEGTPWSNLARVGRAGKVGSKTNHFNLP